MTRISAVVIGQNEAKYIKRCLDNCARWADEVVYFDSLSTDGTDEIARLHKSGKVRLFSHKFDNVRDQRNRALREARNEWRFVLDADEYLSDELVGYLKGTDLDVQFKDCWVVNVNREDSVDGINQGGGPIGVLIRNGITHGGHPIHSDRHVGYEGPIGTLHAQLSIKHEKDMVQWMERSRMYWWCCPYTFTEWGQRPGRPPGSEDLEPPAAHFQQRDMINVYEEFHNAGLDKRLTREYLEKRMVVTADGWGWRRK